MKKQTSGLVRAVLIGTFVGLLAKLDHCKIILYYPFFFNNIISALPTQMPSANVDEIYANGNFRNFAKK